MEKELINLFCHKFKSSPQIASSAPGRINIIGEHTDYTLGYVLPAAIDKKIYFLASQRKDSIVHLWSEQFQEEDTFSLKKINFSFKKNWSNYARGILNLLIQKGFHLNGINGLIWGNIPIGAGLSSSAALEVSILNGLNQLFNLNLKKKEIAFFTQKVEQEFVGVQCGIMDQFISVFGKKNKALFLDCETLKYEEIPLNLKKNNLSILVYDTRIKRDLSSTAYNERHAQTEKALTILKSQYQIETFKQVTIEMLDEASSFLGEILFKRAKHIITENKRVKEAVLALRNNNFKILSQLLFQSHASLRDNYEVSCPELDFFYDIGLKFQGCYGARLTGAGFGGSALALVKKDCAEDFQKLVLSKSKKHGFKTPKFHKFSIGSGAKVEVLS